MAISIFDDVNNKKDNVELKLSKEDIDIEPHINGIVCALECCINLEQLKDAIASGDDTDIVNKTNVTIDNIRKSLFMPEANKLSTESNKDAKTIATEGVVETLKEIWEAIVKTFKYIIEKIKSFFSKSQIQAKATSSKAERNNKTAQKTTEELIEYKVDLSEVENKFVESDTLISHLRYLSKTLTSNDLADLLVKFENNINVLKDLVTKAEAQYVTIEQETAKVPNINNLIERVNGDTANNIYTVFNSGVEAIPIDQSDYAVYKKKLNDSIEIKDDVIDSESVKILKGFINGGALLAYKLNNRQKYVYRLKTLDLSDDRSSTVKIPILTLKELEMFNAKTVALSKSMEDICTLHNQKVNVCHRTMEDILDNLSKLSQVEEYNTDDVNNIIEIIRNVPFYLQGVITSITMSFEMAQNTLTYYVSLSQYYTQYYEHINAKSK